MASGVVLSSFVLSSIGWVATACFGLSYFFQKPATLRVIQACAAVLWIVYGVLIHATPVVAANVIVAGAALYSNFMGRSRAAKSCAAASQPENGTV